MPQDPTELARDLQNLISEALAAGMDAETVIDVLASAVEDLERQNGADNDEPDDQPA